MNIYVSNLSNDVTKDELKEVFEKYGEVASVNIIKDSNTGKSKGFGFIQVAGKSKAWDAINGLNHRETKGRAIQVSKARQMEDQRERFRRPGRR